MSTLEQDFDSLRPPFLYRNVMDVCFEKLLIEQQSYFPILGIDPAVTVLLSSKLIAPPVLEQKILQLYTAFENSNQNLITIPPQTNRTLGLLTYLHDPRALLYLAIDVIETAEKDIIQRISEYIFPADQYNSIVYFTHHPEVTLLIKYIVLVILQINSQQLTPSQCLYTRQQAKIFTSRIQTINLATSRLLHLFKTFDKIVMPLIADISCCYCSGYLCQLAKTSELLLGLISAKWLLPCAIASCFLSGIRCIAKVIAPVPSSSLPRALLLYNKESSQQQSAPDQSIIRTLSSEEKSIQHKLQTEKLDSVGACLICLETLTHDGGVAFVCNDVKKSHFMCVACANGWAMQKRYVNKQIASCPLCKQTPRPYQKDKNS